MNFILFQALSANNTVLNDHHLRVSRSDSTGAAYDPKCAIFIGNMPFAIEDEVLRSKFEKCGEIDSVRIVRDKKTNAGKGRVNFLSFVCFFWRVAQACHFKRDDYGLESHLKK